jgi:oligoendopeptidase F
MEQLLGKIDNYLEVQEKKDVISASLDTNKELSEIIELVRKSDDMEKTLSFFSPEIKEQIQKLIEGGII